MALVEIKHVKENIKRNILSKTKCKRNKFILNYNKIKYFYNIYKNEQRI